MIKNVVFDFGQVVVHFEPAYMVKKYVTDEKDAKLLAEVLFDRLYWDRLDAGTITDQEVLTACKARLPQNLWDVTETIYYNWIYNIPEIEGMPDLIKHVKHTHGKHVYLLSNISTYFSDRADEIPVLELFENCIFSAACGMVKPNVEIFEHLCKTCNILPEESIFVDDNAKNIESAKNFGLHGYLFDGDVAKLQQYFDKLFTNKRFVFTIDDNIRFLEELTQENFPSLFAHPYTKMLQALHEKYGIKIQLNLFYQTPTFNLSKMTEQYKDEWIKNSDWLKLSFHSLFENVCPYENSGYEEVYDDCQLVEKEILRFAGENSLAKTTTIHYCQTSPDALRAIKDRNVQGLLGLYGSIENKQNSYNLSESEAQRARNGEIVYSNGIAYSGIDVVLNCFSIPEILTQLEKLKQRELVKIMIHEQYFYQDYAAYQPNFQEKLETAFDFLIKNGFSSIFFEDAVTIK